MRSFIFSFKTPLQIATIGLCIFFGYNALLLFAGDRVPAGPLQSIDEANEASIDAYLRSGLSAPFVVTGSSLSALLPEDAFPGGASILAQVGGTALTGLDVVLAQDARPKTVFVEVNYLFRAPDTKMVSKAGDKMLQAASRLLPSLQVRFRPLNLMLALAKGFWKKSGNESADAVVDSHTYDLAVDATREGKMHLLDQTALNHRLGDVRTALDRLTRKGVRVVLVEMPIDPRLRQTPQVRQIFDSAERILPQNAYVWFHPPRGNYLTMDGEHMVRSVARRFAILLANAA